MDEMTEIETLEALKEDLDAIRYPCTLATCRRRAVKVVSVGEHVQGIMLCRTCAERWEAWNANAQFGIELTVTDL